MEIKIDGRNIVLSDLKRYRDRAVTITLSYVNFGNDIAYVVVYHDDPVFFSCLAAALNDLKKTLYSDEMIKLMESLII